MAYAIFDTPAIHRISGIKELAQPGCEMVRPLVIAPVQLLQVLDDSSVNIALPSVQDEVLVPAVSGDVSERGHAVELLPAWPRRRDHAAT
ncbi:hypothetical protein ACIQ7Q_23695 [Streptomyces sp. NPDC096176]|uniref:hypothetical protein n=1 Tax=Streptomyces sp. NPDC096176 TaxID=3366079 RepID=UPI0037FB639C